MSTYYFSNHDDACCYTLACHKEQMKELGETQREVFKARLTKEDMYFYCQEVCEVGEKGECGKQCEDYAPRNKKSGACRFYRKLYEQTDEKKIIKIK